MTLPPVPDSILGIPTNSHDELLGKIFRKLANGQYWNTIQPFENCREYGISPQKYLDALNELHELGAIRMGVYCDEPWDKCCKTYWIQATAGEKPL